MRPVSGVLNAKHIRVRKQLRPSGEVRRPECGIQHAPGNERGTIRDLLGVPPQLAVMFACNAAAMRPECPNDVAELERPGRPCHTPRAPVRPAPRRCSGTGRGSYPDSGRQNGYADRSTHSSAALRTIGLSAGAETNVLTSSWPAMSTRIASISWLQHASRRRNVTDRRSCRSVNGGQLS